eukprot:TRINITY_DN160_c0_g1_i1.p1 TRINITY_DN160_c0_g1~~TRINITY_DN160_c0_g1_i1.p1  ORF type:complete len:178 (+),score=90.95 TRINITY_DN160_c0_g1_i1:158-691(+)
MSVQKAEVFEVEVPKTPTKVKSSIQQKLENSPRKILTPEQLKEKDLKAEQRRESLEAAKVQKAHDNVEKAKQVAKQLKLNKENNVPPSPVKPEVFEVPINKTPIKNKPLIQQKLENSPKKILTPEQLKEKDLKAEQRRESLESARVQKAHDDVQKAKTVARKLKLGKEAEKENEVVV